MSRRHAEQPYRFDWGGQRYEVRYLPAESDSGMFGGNSNWRGPVWFPMNLVICARCSSCTATTATTSRSSARPGRAAR